MMDFNVFVNKVIQMDDRNVFGKYVGDLSNIPETMHLFYQTANPIDVEIKSDIFAYRFYPVDSLYGLQQLYKLPEEAFVFATCNGDPVFLLDNQVFTSLDSRYVPELLSNSFDEFLDSIVDCKIVE